MVSKRGQAVLISLQNDPQLAGGQSSAPVLGLVDCFEWRRPRQWHEWPAIAGRKVLLAPPLGACRTTGSVAQVVRARA
jgi:hypothetical protein